MFSHLTLGVLIELFSELCLVICVVASFDVVSLLVYNTYLMALIQS